MIKILLQLFYLHGWNLIESPLNKFIFAFCFNFKWFSLLVADPNQEEVACIFLFLHFPTVFKDPLFSISVCRDVEGNKIETVGNVTFRSCNMLTVLWVFPPFRHSCSILSSSLPAVHLTIRCFMNVFQYLKKKRVQWVIRFHWGKRPFLW